MPKQSPGQQRLFEKKLFYGDNLRILRMPEYFPPESVDLVYLDPPFKPNENYNVLFRDQGNSVPSASQVRAFEDTWQWGTAARDAFNDTKENAPHHVRKTVEALHTILGFSNMFAYLAMMAPRLVELHTVMKPTGSLFLHCDPAASHYLKVLLDSVFGPENFRNEIIWKRTGSHGGAKRFGPVHDVILYVTRSESYTWNQVHAAYDSKYLRKFSKRDADGALFQDVSLTGPGLVAKGDSGLPWHGVDPSAGGRHWQPSSTAYDVYERLTGENLASLPLLERLTRFDDAGLIYWPKDGAGVPRFKQRLEDMPGVAAQDVITDVPPINSQAAERLGYPTQKPVALLGRLIAAASNPGDVVLDPFCGCGTSIEAAEGLGRQWAGIDITYDAIPIIRDRLAKRGLTDGKDYEVWGSPETVTDAGKLARDDPYQFQWWAVRRLGAKETVFKKGADRGVDGRLTLVTDAPGQFPQAVISVKAGQTGPAHVRELAGTMKAQKAEVGVLVVLRPPTKAMREAAESEGGYPGVGGEWCPRLQILTAGDVIDGVGVKAPSTVPATTKRAVRTE